PPEHEYGGIHHQHHEQSRDHPADHGRGDALHHIGAGAAGEQNRNQPHKQRQPGHQHGTDALAGTTLDDFGHVPAGIEPAFHFAIAPDDVQVHHHQQTQLYGEARHGDHAHPDRDAELEVQPPQQPDGAAEGKGHTQHHHQGLGE